MRIARLGLLTLLVFGLSVISARADSFGFSCVTDPQSDCGGIEDQFLVDVTSVGGGTQVQFHFTNNVGTASSITDIYFDENDPPTFLAAPMTLSGSAGVDFSQGASPGNLPGGGTFDAVFSADSTPPSAPNGINGATEWLNITFNLGANQTFATVINALSTGALRLGLHVQAIGPTGTSSSWINDGNGGPNPPPPPPAPIPEPATMLMLGSGLAGLAAKVRAQRRAR